MSIISNIASFLAKTLDSSESQSFGRFASLLTLVFCLGWDTAYVCFITHYFSQFHFTATDILPAAGILMAQGAFCSLFYFGGKGADVLRDKNNGQPPQQ